MVLALSVGTPWPHSLPGEGMQAELRPAAGGLAVWLVVVIDQPSSDEVHAMRKRPLRLGLLPSDPIIWFLLSTEGLSRDAPYAIGLYDERRRSALIAAARQAQMWSEGTRGSVTVPLVDFSDNKIQVLRVISYSAAWFQTLADALVASDRPLSRSDYDAAIDRDQRRWPSTADMLAAATITEIGGR